MAACFPSDKERINCNEETVNSKRFESSYEKGRGLENAQVEA